MSSPRRYYVLDTAHHFRVFLPWEVGEWLEREMMSRTGGVACVTDLAGSRLTVALEGIATLYSSTPETRAMDHAMQADREREAKELSPPEWER